MSETNNNLSPLSGEPADAEDPRLDDLLRTAMQARPEPVAPHDLAGRAMRLAEQAQGESAVAAQISAQFTHQLARQRRWGQFAGLAAAMLIVAMLAGAAHRMYKRGDIAGLFSSTSTAIESTSSDSTGDAVTDADSSSYDTTRTIAIVFVAELLVMGVVLISMGSRAPSGPWGAEALAGLW